KLHANEGAAVLPLTRIPRQAFESFPGTGRPTRRFGTITLTTDSLQPRGGGLPPVPGQPLKVQPAPAQPSNPRAKLKLFGLRDVVVAPTVYDGVIRANETGRLVAIVEISIQ